MRKPRVIVFDDEDSIITFFSTIFSSMGYEVISHNEPLVCPIYGNNDAVCSKAHPCADIMITDLMMPRMNGLDLLQEQARRGCKLTIKNKALMSGYLDEDTIRRARDLGCAFFQKPFELDELTAWVAECEQRIDLSQPLAIRRKELRHPLSPEIPYSLDFADKLVSCHAVNSSDSGLCLKLPFPPEHGQLVTVVKDAAGASRAAVVRWVNKQNDGLYLAGLNCF